MNINNIKRALDNEGIWYSALCENQDVNIEETTTVPHLCSEMHRKLFFLTSANIKEVEKVSDWTAFANVVLESNCAKCLRRLSPLNLLIVSKNDIGRAIDAVHKIAR